MTLNTDGTFLLKFIWSSNYIYPAFSLEIYYERKRGINIRFPYARTPVAINHFNSWHWKYAVPHDKLRAKQMKSFIKTFLLSLKVIRIDKNQILWSNSYVLAYQKNQICLQTRIYYTLKYNRMKILVTKTPRESYFTTTDSQNFKNSWHCLNEVERIYFL